MPTSGFVRCIISFFLKRFCLESVWLSWLQSLATVVTKDYADSTSQNDQGCRDVFVFGRLTKGDFILSSLVIYSQLFWFCNTEISCLSSVSNM